MLHLLLRTASLAALVVFARNASAQANDVFDVADIFLGLLNSLGRLLWVLAIMLFFWGIVKFIANATDSTEREKGKKLIIWGLISFVVLVSIWGIVGLLLSDTVGSTGGVLPFINKSGSVVGGNAAI